MVLLESTCIAVRMASSSSFGMDGEMMVMVTTLPNGHLASRAFINLKMPPSATLQQNLTGSNQ